MVAGYALKVITCSNCGAENPLGKKFCGDCGSALTAICASCGGSNAPDKRFCGDCGAPLEVGAVSVAAPAPAATVAPVAERRLVSVLFADLVGFTTASEARDAEDTRELLTRYFDSSRQIVERYGGTVEKFIGDAVMAVWGAPVAQEDDAERAVRAALDLVAGISVLGQEVGAPDLRARAGVLTGEAAVSLGAEGQGMVAGDLVNTASRVQGAAEPGSVLVGEATKRASEAAIVYEDAGTHELKGKAEPVRLWRASRVVGSRRGEGRSMGLEAPFVGRDREFRLVKDLFHATADDRRASLVAVVGVAGIGKSRLAWEFEKYLDGLVDNVWWHRGRCLSYGDGVAYWALAEMVRMRARIAEDDPPEEALGKLRATIEEHIPDPDEREWVEPRLQHVLGLTDRVAPDREDLHSAWRLFFERMAETAPVVLLFEDLHWADAALLDFIEYLLDWSRSHPLYVLTLSRPELGDRHPTFGTRIRNSTALTLEPLDDAAMDSLLHGLVPGLPEELRVTIRDRADGIPLYAVETVRMLLDRGLLEPYGDGYRVSGPVEALEVPETLHALIAARLDGLEPLERGVLEDAAVLGKTFTQRGLTAVSGSAEADLEPILALLVRKELLTLQTDPRSPERGQYGFLQALVQRVAYDTLARRDRKARHLAAAGFLELEAGLDPDEIAEVIAAHYLDAHAADPEAGDADDVKTQAREWLARAGERAAALAAPEDARRAFDRAAELADADEDCARLLERAGEMALAANDVAAAEEVLRDAQARFEAAGLSHDAARATAQLSLALWGLGRGEEALELLEPALAVLAEDEPDENVAQLAAEAGRIHHFQGDNETARERIELALEIAEARGFAAVLSEALNTKALVLERRPNESRALLREALAIALQHDHVPQALRAYNNLAVYAFNEDRDEEARRVTKEGFELASSRGERQYAVQFGMSLVAELLWDGDWDGAFALADELPLEVQTGVAGHVYGCLSLARAAYERSDSEQAESWMARISPDVGASKDIQLRHLTLWQRAVVAIGERRPADAVPLLEEVVQMSIAVDFLGYAQPAFEDAATAANDLRDPSLALPVVALLDATPPGRRTRPIELSVARIRANAAAGREEHDTAAEEYALALATARNLAKAALLGPVLFDYGRWLVQTGRAEEAAPLLEEARAIFERMKAVRWLERVAEVIPSREPETAIS
jgi:class 3 adenylate cyclase/tetratricopeptide (TPR) repeat protein